MTTDSPLRGRLRSALVDARRARDAATVSTLRTVLAALENAEAVPVTAVPAAGAIEAAAVGVGAADAPRRVLSDDEETAVLDAEVASLAEAAGAYAEVAPERAEAARAAITVLTGLRGGG